MLKFITQDEKIINAVKDYRVGRVVSEQAKETMEEAKQTVIVYMNDNGVEDMKAGNNRVKITRYTSVRFDTVKFRQDYPELAARYTQGVEAIRFTVKDA